MKKFLLTVCFFVVTRCSRDVAGQVADPCVGLANNVKVNDPANCGAFWTCVEEEALIPGQCAGDVPIFNPNTSECDTIENYFCEDTPAIPEVPETPDVEPDRCQDKDNGYFINDPSHCHAFHVCWNNRISLSGRCDELNFNEEKQLCDWQFDCNDNVIEPPLPTTPGPDSLETTPIVTQTTQEATTEEISTVPTTAPGDDIDAPLPLCPPTGVLNVMKPGSCVNYFFCFNGVPLPSTCLPELQFDSEQGGCNRKELVRCRRDECPSVDDLGNIVFLQSANSCSEHYVCVGGDAKLLECLGDLQWDQNLGSCNVPEQIECEIEE